MAIFKKGVVTLPQRLQWILLNINQYGLIDLNMPGPQLYIDDWLSRHTHTEGKEEEIIGMNLDINAVQTCTHIPECMMVEEIGHAMQVDEHLNALTACVING